MFNDNIPFVGREDGISRENNVVLPSGLVNSGVARICVVGVGGAGNNAVNRMIEAGITSADYVAVNTDAQILACNKAQRKIQIGAQRTKGLGAGAEPEIGREAAEESKEALAKAVEGVDLLFITAGMGGGTGTGAAPVIAKIAKDKKILTVAVVTKPFEFEGKRRMDNAIKGIDNLRKYVDTIIIIPNEKIREVVPKNATMTDALRVADEVLKQGIRGIADLIVTPALISGDDHRGRYGRHPQHRRRSRPHAGRSHQGGEPHPRRRRLFRKHHLRRLRGRERAGRSGSDCHRNGLPACGEFGAFRARARHHDGSRAAARFALRSGGKSLCPSAAPSRPRLSGTRRSLSARSRARADACADARAFARARGAAAQARRL